MPFGLTINILVFALVSWHNRNWLPLNKMRCRDEKAPFKTWYQSLSVFINRFSTDSEVDQKTYKLIFRICYLFYFIFLRLSRLSYNIKNITALSVTSYFWNFWVLLRPRSHISWEIYVQYDFSLNILMTEPHLLFIDIFMNEVSKFLYSNHILTYAAFNWFVISLQKSRLWNYSNFLINGINLWINDHIDQMKTIEMAKSRKEICSTV